MPSEQLVITLWAASLAMAVVVVGVVGVLLALIMGTAARIREVVEEIWTAGQQVANDTVHIPLLARTDRLLRQVVERARSIDEAAARIEAHAAGCPGCPQCALGAGRRAP